METISSRKRPCHTFIFITPVCRPVIRGGILIEPKGATRATALAETAQKCWPSSSGRIREMFPTQPPLAEPLSRASQHMLSRKACNFFLESPKYHRKSTRTVWNPWWKWNDQEDWGKARAPARPAPVCGDMSDSTASSGGWTAPLDFAWTHHKPGFWVIKL